MAEPKRASRISADTIEALQKHLRKKLGCATLALDPPATRNASIQVRIDREVVGTIEQIEDEGEKSWAVTLIVLEEDLAP